MDFEDLAGKLGLGMAVAVMGEKLPLDAWQKFSFDELTEEIFYHCPISRKLFVLRMALDLAKSVDEYLDIFFLSDDLPGGSGLQKTAYDGAVKLATSVEDWTRIYYGSSTEEQENFALDKIRELLDID